tara:strand:+ start:3993 stop:8282 length:4290 start_codon:yes stop_codon:yes gene_type:complete
MINLNEEDKEIQNEGVPIIEEEPSQDEPIIEDQSLAQNTVRDQFLQNIEVPEEGFKKPRPKAIYKPPAFGGGYGNSTVDLSIKENSDLMQQEYQTWWGLSRNDPDREALREEWYQKYRGMSFEDFKKEYIGIKPKRFIGNVLQDTKDDLKWAYLPLIAKADFVTDAIGTLGGPWGSKLDDKWDKSTQMGGPVYQNIRKAMSIILPSMWSGGMTNNYLQANGIKNMPFLQKHLTRLGAFSLESAVIAGLSDTSEDDNLPRVMADMFPNTFGANGRIPLPEEWKTKDSQSPEMKKVMNMYFDASLSFVGVILGAALDSGKLAKGKPRKLMDWFLPKDPQAEKYKRQEVIKKANPDTLIEIQKINELLSIGGLSRNAEQILINKKLQLEEGLDYLDDVDELIRRSDTVDEFEAYEAAKRKIDAGDIDSIDPDVSRGVLDKSKEARRLPREGNVARNMADSTAIKKGDVTGDPAPLITEAMRRKGLMVGPASRGAVMGVAEETRALGNFDAIVDSFRYTNKQMNAAAWGMYQDIIDPGNDVSALKDIFMDNRDIKNLLLGNLKISYLNEEQMRSAGFAIKYLTDRYLGRSIGEASARVMDSLGREAAGIAESIQKMGPYIDDDRSMELIIDKMQYLLDEYALGKYISGWSLKNKDWFDQIPPNKLEEVVETLTKEFQTAENAIHARNLRFTNTLIELKKTNPLAMRPLVDAFAHTNGDVDTLAKLMKFTQDTITPWGMVKSPNPKQLNHFTKGVWGVVMNNVLSGMAVPNAVIGNIGGLILKPIDQFLGAMIWGFTDNFEGIRQFSYLNGALYETNRRALDDGLRLMAKAHNDPDFALRAYRKDFAIKSDKEFAITKEMRDVWIKDGKVGNVILSDISELFHSMAKMKGLRYGMTGLVFPDAFTNTMQSHWLSRVRAFDDVFSEYGYTDKKIWSQIRKAERKHHGNMFDKDMLIKDKALKYLAGEISLNIDDELAMWLTQASTAYPVTRYMFMFPRTQSNAMKTAASFTPISAIPGMNRFSKTIYAQSDDEIAAVLKEHGIDMATDPNARAIFKRLREEYTGRLALSGLLVGTLWQRVMNGDCRGEGHYNSAKRRRDRDLFNWQPRTCRFPVPGKGEDNDVWVPIPEIAGVSAVVRLLSDIGLHVQDLNENVLENWQAKLTWIVAANYLGNSPLSGFSPFVRFLNGDLKGFQREAEKALNNTVVPASSMVAMIAKASDTAVKEVRGEFLGYLRSRVPWFRSQLHNKNDLFTGKPLYDCDHPIQRITNATWGFPVSCGNEWWRKEIRGSGWDGLPALNKDSTGSVEYTAEQKEWIMNQIGKQEMYKDFIKILRMPRHQKTLKELRVHLSSNANLQNPLIKLKAKRLPLYKEFDRILKEHQARAEAQLAIEREDIRIQIDAQLRVNDAMSKGDISKARELQRKHREQNELLNMSK